LQAPLLRWLAFREGPGLANGLHLGLPITTACTAALFLGTLLFWRARPRDE
jgi:hypothetical protein